MIAYYDGINRYYISVVFVWYDFVLKVVKVWLWVWAETLWHGDQGPGDRIRPTSTSQVHIFLIVQKRYILHNQWS